MATPVYFASSLKVRHPVCPWTTRSSVHCPLCTQALAGASFADAGTKTPAHVVEADVATGRVALSADTPCVYDRRADMKDVCGEGVEPGGAGSPVEFRVPADVEPFLPRASDVALIDGDLETLFQVCLDRDEHDRGSTTVLAHVAVRAYRAGFGSHAAIPRNVYAWAIKMSLVDAAEREPALARRYLEVHGSTAADRATLFAPKELQDVLESLGSAESARLLFDTFPHLVTVDSLKRAVQLDNAAAAGVLVERGVLAPRGGVPALDREEAWTFVCGAWESMHSTASLAYKAPGLLTGEGTGIRLPDDVLVRTINSCNENDPHRVHAKKLWMRIDSLMTTARASAFPPTMPPAAFALNVNNAILLQLVRENYNAASMYIKHGLPVLEPLLATLALWYTTQIRVYAKNMLFQVISAAVTPEMFGALARRVSVSREEEYTARVLSVIAGDFQDKVAPGTSLTPAGRGLKFAPMFSHEWIVGGPTRDAENQLVVAVEDNLGFRAFRALYESPYPKPDGLHALIVARLRLERSSGRANGPHAAALADMLAYLQRRGAAPPSS